jgi:AcrR family transcriptional regulator
MKKNEVKSKILRTAGHLFYTQGYNSTGINQIIDESDIARGSLYNHFKSKTDLLHDYLKDLDNDWFDKLHKHIDNIEDSKEKILGIFDFRINRQLTNNFGGCPFIKVSAEVPAGDARSFEIIGQNKMRLRDLILEILQHVHFKTSSMPREQLANMLYMLMEGATVTANFQKNESMMIQAKNGASSLLNSI